MVSPTAVVSAVASVEAGLLLWFFYGGALCCNSGGGRGIAGAAVTPAGDEELQGLRVAFSRCAGRHDGQ